MLLPDCLPVYLPAWINPLTISQPMLVFWCIGAFFLAIVGGEWINESLGTLALALKVDAMIVGLLITNIIGAVPIITITGLFAYQGLNDMALGTVIGGSWLTLVLPVAIAALSVPISIKPGVVNTDLPLFIVYTGVFLFFCLHGQLGQGETVGLLGMAITYLVLKYKHGQDGRYGMMAFGKNFVFGASIDSMIFKLCGGLAFIAIACWYLSMVAKTGVSHWNWPALPSGFLAALPFCLPEIMFALSAIKKGQGEVVISRGLWMSMSILLIGGGILGAMKTSLNMTSMRFLPAAFLGILLILWWILRKSQRLWRWEAAVLLIITGLSLAVAIAQGYGYFEQIGLPKEWKL